MNTKGKEKKEKSITASEGEATESNVHTPAREYHRDSEEKEPKTKAGKRDKNLGRSEGNDQIEERRREEARKANEENKRN